jgi:hypothetical protein
MHNDQGKRWQGRPAWPPCYVFFTNYSDLANPCLTLPRTGREENVLFIKANENNSFLFHGNKETSRAIAQ